MANKLLLNPKDYKKYFTFSGALSCLQGEFILKGPLAKAGIFLFCKPDIFTVYINRKKERLCLEHGLKLFSNKKEYWNYLNEFRNYVKFVEISIIPKYKEMPKTLTKEEFEKDIGIIGKLWHYYGFAEFPYTDLAYKIADKEVQRNLNEISRFKFKGREIMNVYFFKKGVIDNILAFISNKFLQEEDDAKYLYSDEILQVFDGKIPAKSVINQRKKCYSAAVIDGKTIRFSHESSLQHSKKFDFPVKRDIVFGITANSGTAKGRVIVAPMLNNHKEIQELDKIMKKGDILVAESTSPDIILLCKKASAIVAEQGGMLSHAAVISREMNVPCIVQATFATRILKNRDFVEVNADKGIVKKIKD